VTKPQEFKFSTITKAKNLTDNFSKDEFLTKKKISHQVFGVKKSLATLTKQ
jgi:hypothetical protein